MTSQTPAAHTLTAPLPRTAFSFLLGALALTTLVTPQTALAAPTDMVGTWVNTDVATSGITRINVTRTSAGKMTVQVFGRCHPNDCDWGQANALTYGANVSDSNHFTASAVYAKGFATTTLVLNFARGRLDVQALTQFTDSSGRQNYASQSAFARYR
ncbi:hypothetical protein GO986_21650 [Deinococcus sp. HMF7620]|uniref:Uncharacterized protein n=1 Tax=Deinococcus arboris TaxID=2682977 RepID=A0A7C9MBS4_9DEIO|nr:hypothetical protein [Deinococcus arboris]MVN89343.1 hypothetical protein [Deinococcus arboris]